MKVYTRTGDNGKTSLFGGSRVLKDTQRIEAYGSVDELNAHIGAVRSLTLPPDVDRVLERVQQHLFILGADLATPPVRGTAKIVRIESRHVEFLERSIDHMDASLPALRQFILPAGSRTVAELHVARTVCRRAERRIVQLSRKSDIGTMPIVYINRLSDLLFVATRYVNKFEGGDEKTWDSNRAD